MNVALECKLVCNTDQLQIKDRFLFEGLKAPSPRRKESFFDEAIVQFAVSDLVPGYGAAKYSVIDALIQIP